MSDAWAIALGVLFLCIWVSLVTYYGAVRKAYTQGRMDQIRHKNESVRYHGPALYLYKRGRRSQALRHRIAVRSRMNGGGYGTPSPR